MHEVINKSYIQFCVLKISSFCHWQKIIFFPQILFFFQEKTSILKESVKISTTNVSKLGHVKCQNKFVLFRDKREKIKGQERNLCVRVL